MANQAGYTQYAGTFVDAWAGEVINSYKTVTPILSRAKFSQGEMQGGVFHWALVGTIESGVTLTAARATAGESGLPYIGARSGQAPDYQIEAPQVHARSRITYEALARSMADIDSSATDRKKAVRAASKLVMDGLAGGTVKKLEALMLHGRTGLGQIEAISNVVAASTVAGNENANPFDGNAAGFILDVQVTPATWAEAIFMQCEGGTFDLWSNVGGTPTAKLNVTANAVLTSGVNQTGAVLTAINPPTPNTGLASTAERVLRLFHTSGTAGGTGVGVFGGAAWAALAAGFIFYESGGPATEFVSLTSQARSTTSNFGVSAVQYSVARGNLRNNVGNLKLGDLVRYLSRPINKGAMGMEITAVVPTELFAQFANDESMLRRYGARDTGAKNGFQSIEMYLPHGSTLELLGHNMQHDGSVLCYVPAETHRIGAQDLDFIRRGGQGGTDAILEVAQSPASEWRMFGQFAPFAEAASHMLSLTGVTF